jgi:hypothetical protein
MSTPDTIDLPAAAPTTAMLPASASPSQASVGQLADETPDVMTLHTQDAYRMFTGRVADAQTQAPAIPGGRRFAAVLKSIWYLSANDNPYADWILIRVYQSLVAIRAQMAQAIAGREAEFEALRRKGLEPVRVAFPQSCHGRTRLSAAPTAMPRPRPSSSSTTTCAWSRRWCSRTA